MFNIFHLARGAFAGIRPLKNGRMKEELSLLLSELSFPVLYLKSVISVDLFGLPQSDLCFQENRLCTWQI